MYPRPCSFIEPIARSPGPSPITIVGIFFLDSVSLAEEGDLAPGSGLINIITSGLYSSIFGKTSSI